MLFPLRLTPFEEYMLMDDLPAYPMAGFLRLRFSGRFDRTALECAQREAFRRHPLLLATAHRGWLGRWYWRADHEGPEPIGWLGRPGDDTYPLVPDRIDLMAQPGVRLLVAEDEQSSDLIMHLHHAACDGLGGMQFFEDLLVAYAQKLGVAPPRPVTPPIDPRRLRQCARFGLTRSQLLRLMPKQIVGLLGVRQFLQRSALPLAPGGARPADGPMSQGFPASVVRQLDEGQVARLRAAAAGLGVTSNDVLVRDLFLALEQWRGDHYTGH